MRLRLAIGDFAILAILTLLVWGVCPLDRGLRFASDDANFFQQAWSHQNDSPLSQLSQRYFFDLPTRSLAFWPFVVSVHVDAPALWLQCFYALSWLLNGVAAARLVHVVLPRSPLFGYVAGCLAVTATSDSMTGSVVYGPHIFGIALFFFGAAELLRSISTSSSYWRLVLAATLLLLSFFTVEYTYPGVPLLVVFVCLYGRMHTGRWPYVQAMTSLVAFLPAAAVVIAGILTPGSYAETVLAPKASFTGWIGQVFDHFAHNFLPFNWAFRAVPPWRHDYAPIFPLGVFLALSVAGAAVFLFRARCLVRRDRPSTTDSRGSLYFATLSFAAAAAINAVLSSTGEYFIRSHFASRIWSSIGLAFLVAALWPFARLRLIALGASTVFVFAGVWGGIERQSFLLGLGLHEHRQLSSLARVLPAAPEHQKIVVIHPPGSPSLIALDNGHTLPFFYDDDNIRHRVILAPNSEEQYSSVSGEYPDKLVVTYGNGTRYVAHASECVILFFSVQRGEYILLDRIPAGLLKNASEFEAAYHPASASAHAASITRSTLASERLAPPRLERLTPPRKTIEVSSLIASTPALTSALAVEPFAPRSIEQTPNGPLVWLGSGESEGFSLLIWSESSVTVDLRLSLNYGPDHSLAEIPVHVASGLVGEEAVQTSQLLSQSSPLVFRIGLRPGPNIVEAWTMDPAIAIPPERPDQRKLVASLHRLELLSVRAPSNEQ